MCVIFFAFNYRQNTPFILLANRDEFYDRPSAAAKYWDDFPHIYGGRDLLSGGTWLGITKKGRFAAVTNFRDPAAPAGSRSRGNLVADYLKSDMSAEIYLQYARADAQKYSGFNILIGEINDERRELFYFSNREDSVRKLSAGIYGLSNHFLDTPWPKVVKGKSIFTQMLQDGEILNEDLFQILSDDSFAADEDLPTTGASRQIEKALSAIFIKTPGYGTRCSSILRFNGNLEWDFDERIFA